MIQNLMGKVDTIIIGGAMAYTFLKAQGHDVGKSLVEDDKLDLARQLLEHAKATSVKFLLPIDHIAAMKIDVHSVVHTIAPGEPIPHDMMGLDIGPKSIALFT